MQSASSAMSSACRRAIGGREEEGHIRTGRTILLVAPLIGLVPILQFLVRFFIVRPEVPADGLCQQPYLAFVTRKLSTEMSYKAAWLHPYPRRIHKFTTIDVSPKWGKTVGASGSCMSLLTCDSKRLTDSRPFPSFGILGRTGFVMSYFIDLQIFN